MKKLMNFAAVGVLTAVLVLSGCSSKNAEQQNTQVNDQTKTEEAQNTLSISQGSKNMRDALKNMKDLIAANDEDGVAKEGAKLEENWKVFEDSVKGKDKDLYEKVEEPLGIINSAIKVKPFDAKVVSSAIDSLDNELSEVEKLK